MAGLQAVTWLVRGTGLLLLQNSRIIDKKNMGKMHGPCLKKYVFASTIPCHSKALYRHFSWISQKTYFLSTKIICCNTARLQMLTSLQSLAVAILQNLSCSKTTTVKRENFA